MVYYILIIGLFISSIFDYKRTIPKQFKMFIFRFWCIVFLLFKAFAWDTGPDFPQFYGTFEYSKWDNIFSYWRYGLDTELMEPGFVFINVLVKTFLPHYTFFRLIMCGFILYSFTFLIFRFVPQYKITALALLIVSTEMFPVRQTIATAILCFSYVFIIERRFKCYLISIISAYLIHKSCLILLPLYWICKVRFNVIYYIPIYIALIVFRIVFQTYFSDIFDSPILSILLGSSLEHYFITEGKLDEFEIHKIAFVIVHLLLFGYVLHVNNRIRRWDTNMLNVFFNIYFILVCFNVIGTLPGIDIVFRLSNNFWVIYPVLIVIVCDILRLRLLRFGHICALLVLTIVWFTKVISNPIFDEKGIYYNIYNPYYSVFDSDGTNLIRHSKWPNFNK